MMDADLQARKETLLNKVIELDTRGLKSILDSADAPGTTACSEALASVTRMFVSQPEDRVKEKFDVCEVLIDAGAILSSVSSKLIHFACYHNKPLLLKKLHSMKSYPSTDKVILHDNEYGPLSCAVLKNNIDCVEVFGSYRPPVTSMTTTYDFESSLELANRLGHTEVLNCLLRYFRGMNTSLTFAKMFANPLESYPRNTVMLLIESGIDVTDLLIASPPETMSFYLRHARRAIRNNKHCQTIPCKLVKCANLERLKYFLQPRFRDIFDLNMQVDGWTPLTLSISRRYSVFLTELLRHNIDTNAPGSAFGTLKPAFLAVLVSLARTCGKYTMFKALIRYGCDLKKSQRLLSCNHTLLGIALSNALPGLMSILHAAGERLDTVRVDYHMFPRLSVEYLPKADNEKIPESRVQECKAMIFNTSTQPSSLQHICRLSIRSILAMNIPCKLSCLQIAPVLKQYLLFNDIEMIEDIYPYLVVDDKGDRCHTIAGAVEYGVDYL